MMAEATPAMIPEVRDTPTFPDLLILSGLEPMAPYIDSAAEPWTANLAIVYGICLKQMGPKPE